MESLLKNPAILQLRKLHKEAIILKEYHDKKLDKEAILAQEKFYLNEFDELKNIIPEHVLKTGKLLKNTSWIRTYNKKKQPALSYKDLKEICLVDIFVVEEKLLEYLSKKTLDTITSLFN
jgi:hypothetical protein